MKLRQIVATSPVFFAVLFACSVHPVYSGPPANRDPNGQNVRRARQLIAHRGASAERPECTSAAILRAIEVGATAVEVDVRTSRDGHLFILHDDTLDRTTNGSGPAHQLNLSELQQLDAGSWFDPSYRNERIPSLRDVLDLCRGKIDVLLDLKEQGSDYDQSVAEMIQKHGRENETIIGVRTVEQSKRFRMLLPRARQLALVPELESVASFVEAGCETIRLWPRWLGDAGSAVQTIRSSGRLLHLNGTRGALAETIELLGHSPDSLSSDDPKRLKASLERIRSGHTPQNQISRMLEVENESRVESSAAAVATKTFLNREYHMLELPSALRDQPRLVFDGGSGHRLRARFRQACVVFAVFEYNDSGDWSFANHDSPRDAGWHRWNTGSYRGSSNGERNGKPHRGAIWFREFAAESQLTPLPAWWLCLAIVPLSDALRIPGFKAGLTSAESKRIRRFDHAAMLARTRPLAIPTVTSADEWTSWQDRQRNLFRERFVFRYPDRVSIERNAESQHDGYRQTEFSVHTGHQRLFRFFRLLPTDALSSEIQLPTIVCFMGHGHVQQILSESASYQAGHAGEFARSGYLVYAMENIGMGPGRDRHLDLDQTLRLTGKGWYSLLFAHQQILMKEVFNDSRVDPARVGATGVSTGGLLALSAAVMEPRIAAASVQGIFGSMRTSFITDRHRHCSCGAIPGLLPEFDLPELALLVAPRPLHISNGKRDGFSAEEARRCRDLIAGPYERFGGRIPQLTMPDADHAFEFAAASRFFGRTIGPIPNR